VRIVLVLALLNFMVPMDNKCWAWHAATALNVDLTDVCQSIPALQAMESF
jgi:hypothetical protein